MMNIVAAAMVACLCAEQAVAAECNMQLAFAQPDRGGARSIAVWKDAPGAALLFADAMNVNTDGTRRSYSVSDFWGEARENGALNNLCNAMADGCAGLSSDQLRARRILTQEARAQGWPADLLARTRLAPSIIPFRDGKPCSEVNGFLVSATALHKREMSDVCDISNYADALTVSSIVLPKRSQRNVATPFESRGARLGDLVAVLSGDRSVLKYAVVGDSGPARELGEISIALASGLLKKTQEPVNYRQIRGKTPYQGQGWTVPQAFVVVFPNSRNNTQPYLTQDRVDAAGKTALENWGGLERLKACAGRYR